MGLIDPYYKLRYGEKTFTDAVALANEFPVFAGGLGDWCTAVAAAGTGNVYASAQFLSAIGKGATANQLGKIALLRSKMAGAFDATVEVIRKNELAFTFAEFQELMSKHETTQWGAIPDAIKNMRFKGMPATVEMLLKLMAKPY